jgi:hypothetical protein
MNGILKKAAAAAFAIALGFGASSASAAAIVIDPGTSATVDGWLISPGNGIGLSAEAMGNTLVLEKTANFPGLESAQIGFLKVSGTASTIEFDNEAITNSGPGAWSGFQFLLLNTGSPMATFAGVSNVFVPPIGTGVDYTSFNLNSAKNNLTYSGSQGSMTISDWGSSTPGDDLLIDTNGATSFSFDEVPIGAVVPLPAAAWQGLVGLLGLGAIAMTRKIKNQIA